jgi:dUTP pyrophosphatase
LKPKFAREAGWRSNTASDYTFRRGDRIAQIVIQKVYRADLQQVEHLDETRRNTGGFGHTGK